MFFLFIPGVRLRDGNCHINVTFSSLSPLYHHDNNHHNDDDAYNKTTTTTTTRPNATTTTSGANGTRDATASRVPGIFLFFFFFSFCELLTFICSVYGMRATTTTTDGTQAHEDEKGPKRCVWHRLGPRYFFYFYFFLF